MIVKQRAKANEIEKMELVGNVEGKTCIIIDDMIDTAGTLCKASNMLKENGADKVFAFATHGLFTGKANENIDNSCLEKVIVTNSIPANYKSNKIDQISVGILIAEAIRRVQNNESLSELFKV
jgi:ribose-phosphate pyrophosphokinase